MASNNSNNISTKSNIEKNKQEGRSLQNINDDIQRYNRYIGVTQQMQNTACTAFNQQASKMSNAVYAKFGQLVNEFQVELSKDSFAQEQTVSSKNDQQPSREQKQEKK